MRRGDVCACVRRRYRRDDGISHLPSTSADLVRCGRRLRPLAASGRASRAHLEGVGGPVHEGCAGVHRDGVAGFVRVARPAVRDRGPVRVPGAGRIIAYPVVVSVDAGCSRVVRGRPFQRCRLVAALGGECRYSGHHIVVGDGDGGVGRYRHFVRGASAHGKLDRERLVFLVHGIVGDGERFLLERLVVGALADQSEICDCEGHCLAERYEVLSRGCGVVRCSERGEREFDCLSRRCCRVGCSRDRHGDGLDVLTDRGGGVQVQCHRSRHDRGEHVERDIGGFGEYVTVMVPCSP